MGLAPLEPLRMTLAIEDAAQRLGVASFQNGARPSGVIRTDQDGQQGAPGRAEGRHRTASSRASIRPGCRRS
jgi:phage portal protein BeeE